MKSRASFVVKCALVVCTGIAVATASEFSPVTAPVDGCPGQFFVKKARVFDAVTLCATKGVNKSKLQHAANVTAQWLDNDEDGNVDEPRLLAHLRRNHATLAMSEEGFSDAAIEQLTPYFATMMLQDLADNETNPVHDRDASQEEIHHLIANAGWQPMLPSVFSDNGKVNSQLRQQWQLAEDKGYYHYDDPTCDSACKTIEFLYLGTAAYLASTADLTSDEMRLKSRQELQHSLPELVNIFESPQYHYPTVKWPDGRYPVLSSIRYTGQGF
ncbi:hypothetical protein [Vibrio methylphosphonaticus]|uniref:hypothetical protein n=1 Tax=Vibrio methylphosphonaticus TaxID=2946866 RepID=UPI00202A61BB|nr:hypothetical protein [Vibrio methylphosphonaticus]MCL9777376.1 hypothetical protein [Vibrio methylphosphonaticus]